MTGKAPSQYAGYRQTDFSGGLFEALSPGDFSDRQLARCYGMVLEGVVSIRSQPPVQQVGSVGGFTALRTFDGRAGDWLIGLRSDGTCWYAKAPSDDASSSACAAVTWAQVTGVAADTALRMLCVVPVGTDDTSYKSGWLLNGRTASGAYVVGENAAGTAITVLASWTNQFPSQAVDANGTMIASVNVMPAADLGCMVGDFLVLGRVNWYKNSTTRAAGTLSASTTKPYNGAVWVSATPDVKTGADGKTKYQEYRIDQWSPIDGFYQALIPNAADLLDMRFTDQGLLLLHTQGATLVRGAMHIDTTTGAGPRPQQITAIGGAPWSSASRSGRSTFWAETGTTCWVESRGSVWSTNGGQVGQLDQFLHLGENAAAGADDQVCGLGPWLVLARGGRMLALRRFDTDAAWTELNAGAGAISNLSPLRFCLYYLAGGAPRRIPFTAENERGRVLGQTFPITVATGTLGDPQSWDRKLWQRVGVTASNASADPAAALVSLGLRAGPSLASPRAAAYLTSLNQPLAQRTEVVVPAGIGPAREAAVEVTFTGDVRLEALYANVRGNRGQR